MCAVADAASSADPVNAVLDKCLLRASDPGGAPLCADGLPDAVVTAIADCMALADPQADVQFALECPACGHSWQALFHIASFLWTEIHVWAQRILRDIGQLASAYGWSETDVLALTPTRRKIYVALSRQ